MCDILSASPAFSTAATESVRTLGSSDRLGVVKKDESLTNDSESNDEKMRYEYGMKRKRVVDKEERVRWAEK